MSHAKADLATLARKARQRTLAPAQGENCIRKIKYKELPTFSKMKRLTAYVSGNVQKVGYRGKVAQTAMALGLKGTAENMPDGRVKIIAEGDEDKLRWFEEAIAIKNTLISVSSVEKTYSQASGDVGGFYKLVTTGETDSRLDQGIEVLKDLLVAVKEMDANLGGKMNDLGCKIDCVGNKMDNLSGKMDTLGDKIDCVGNKIEGLGGKMDSMLDKQDNLITEVKDARKDLTEYMDQRFERIEVDVAEMKTALKEKGII